MKEQRIVYTGKMSYEAVALNACMSWLFATGKTGDSMGWGFFFQRAPGYTFEVYFN